MFFFMVTRTLTIAILSICAILPPSATAPTTATEKRDQRPGERATINPHQCPHLGGYKNRGQMNRVAVRLDGSPCTIVKTWFKVGSIDFPHKKECTLDPEYECFFYADETCSGSKWLAADKTVLEVQGGMKIDGQKVQYGGEEWTGSIRAMRRFDLHPPCTKSK